MKRAFAPNLMDILKSRMKDVRLQVEPDDPYKTMAFANGTLDWSTLKPKKQVVVPSQPTLVLATASAPPATEAAAKAAENSK